MALDMKIEIEGLDEIRAAFKRSPTIVRKHANKAIQKSVLKLLANARPETPIDQGFLRGAGMVISFQDLLGILENKAPYAGFVHEGTGPHSVPLAAITPWALRHGIPPFLVQRSIKRKGTKPKPFFTNSIDKSDSDIDRYFSEALDGISTDLTA